jgi:mannose-6-phosphate isomerase-like protein (cupin superfamily)
MEKQIGKVNINEKLKLINDYWQPKIIGELNKQQVRIAKLKGEFDFHRHENEDEFFLVIKGTLKIEFKDKTATLNEGEFIIVPKGVVHRPVADNEVHVLLFEPDTIVNTGDVINDKTIVNPERI